MADLRAMKAAHKRQDYSQSTDNEQTKDLIDSNINTIDKTKTVNMARTQVTKIITRKGSKQLTDEERASQVASLKIPPVIPPENKGEDDKGEKATVSLHSLERR